MQDLLVATSDFYVADPVLWPLWYFRQERDQLVELGLFPQRTATRGLVVRDINGDGVLDVLAGDAYRSPYLFLSNGCTVSNWIEVEAPPMTRVEVEAGGRTFVSWALAESSWASTAPSVAHIGLGTIETVDAITLTPVWGEPTTVQGPIQARRKVLFSPG